MNIIKCALMLVALSLGSHRAQASGMLIPKDTNLPALAIKHQRVDIDIKDGVASVRVEQVFKNNVDRDLEAVFVFPLPDNAAVGEFAMMINGKRMSGELVEKGKARKIYEDIVRRMKDPGLLEHMGGRLFKISVYPVPRMGEQKIELSYTQTLAYESGMYNFTYPLKTGEQASRTLEDFTVHVTLNTSVPLKTVYSPSHSVGISRKGEHKAVIGFEEDRSLLDRDFTLYYGISIKDFGLNLLTHAVKGQDGYYMLMLAPTVEPPDAEIVKRDVAFVLDTSGSMAGEKITQAREALTYCINRLNKGDRFTVIRFSTDVDVLSDTLLEVTDQNRSKAIAFISELTARGGTAIDAAMTQALGTVREDSEKRPYTVVFLTDGRPTIGETNIDEILDHVDARAGGGARVFAFGLGDDVNTKLLDRMSGDHSGTTRYVRPSEDIEVHVSSFYDKISHPVLASPKVAIDAIKTKMQHPRALQDLFAGQQLIVLGRYRDHGHSAIRLTGDVNGDGREFVFEGVFPETNSDNNFLPQLWATRRVGFLLDAIRQQGEQAELKQEVLALSREFGIMTPYTSYLVLENDAAYEAHDIPRLSQAASGSAMGWASAPREAGSRRAADTDSPSVHLSASAKRRTPERSLRPQSMPVFGDELDSSDVAHKVMAESTLIGGKGHASRDLEKETGRDAIRVSESIEDYKNSELRREDIGSVTKHIAGRIFYKLGDIWTDRDYKDDMKAIRLTYASDKYFAYLADHDDMKRIFALGPKLIVVVDGEAVIVE